MKAVLLAVLLGLACLLQTCNPFAPGLDLKLGAGGLQLGDRRSVKGMFDYFRNTYELRDSTLYGQMIAPEFRFTFFDFSNNNLTFWTRDQEMLATHNMFRRVKAVTLIWNNYVVADTALSDTLAQAERYFNLTIVQDDQNVFRGTGIAQLTLTRRNRNEGWRIVNWFDKSDF